VSIRVGLRHFSKSSMMRVGWVPTPFEAPYIHIYQLLGSLLRPRFSWSWGRDMYARYNEDPFDLYVRISKADLHISAALTATLDLSKNTYIVDFCVLVSCPYPFESAHAFEFSYQPFPSYMWKDTMTAGNPYRGCHDNVLAWCHHMVYTSSRVGSVHHETDATVTRKRWRFVDPSFTARNWIFRRPVWVRVYVSHSKIGFTVPSVMDAKGNRYPDLFGDEGRLGWRTGASTIATKWYSMRVTSMKVYQYATVDYDGDLPAWPSEHPYQPLSSWEDTVPVKWFKWAIKASGGTGWALHGDTASLSSWELNVAALSHYGYFVEKLGGEKELGGTCRFLSGIDTAALSSVELPPDAPFKHVEMPILRQVLELNSPWCFKQSGGTHDFTLGPRDVEALSSLEDDLSYYYNWECLPKTSYWSYAIHNYYDPSALSLWEDNILSWSNGGGPMWLPKASGGTVTVTYG